MSEPQKPSSSDPTPPSQQVVKHCQSEKKMMSDRCGQAEMFRVHGW